LDRYRTTEEKNEYGQKQGDKSWHLGIIILIAVCILGSIAILLYKTIKENKVYTAFEVVSSSEVLSQNKYTRYGTGYIKYNTDGAEGYRDGRTLWNISYNMKKPIVDVCGDYCAFADKGMQTVVITDGQGGNFHINIPEKIVDISVAGQGVVAVWTDSLSVDHIYVYDINGVLLLDIETSIAADGFPLSFDLSDDGKKLVTSYMKLGDELTSWVTFYNFGNVGQNFAGRVVGSYSYAGKIIPEVKFVTNDRVCAFGEDRCILFRMKETPSELATQETVRLSAVCSDSESICLAETETDGTSRITVFDTDGKSKKEIVTGLAFTGMCIEGDELIMYSNSSCIIYYLNGSEKFRTQIDGGIRSIFPAGKDKYCVIGGSEVRTIRLKTEKETRKEEAID